jgi:hypothetical protein
MARAFSAARPKYRRVGRRPFFIRRYHPRRREDEIVRAPAMSALGQKRTFHQVAAMSALPPKADSRPPSRDAMSGHSN